MDHDFWQSRWAANEIGFHQTEINPHLQNYWPGLHVAANGCVFVPLCGKSRDMLWLAAQGQAVLGVEISPIAVRDFFTDNRLTPTITQDADFTVYRSAEITLLQGDYFALSATQLENVSAVYDRASLIALPPALRSRYARHMAALLRPEIPILLVTLDYPQSEMSGPPFAVSSAEVSSLFAADFVITPLGGQDILAENPGFQARGLTRLHEQAYRLVRRQSRN